MRNTRVEGESPSLFVPRRERRVEPRDPNRLALIGTKFLYGTSSCLRHDAYSPSMSATSIKKKPRGLDKSLGLKFRVCDLGCLQGAWSCLRRVVAIGPSGFGTVVTAYSKLKGCALLYSTLIGAVQYGSMAYHGCYAG